MAFSQSTKLQLDKFTQALATLKETAQDSEDRKTRDSLLLRVGYAFETAGEAVRAVQEDKEDLETRRVAFSALETAFKMRYITDESLWDRLRKGRNGVSHAYDEDMAIGLAAMVRLDAIPEFERVLAHLQAQA